MARIALWSCLLLLASFSRPAFGQSSGDDSGASATAEALFRAGREAVRAGQTAKACGYFRESQRLEPMLGTQLNLALCEEELGKLVSAWRLASELVHAPDLDPQRRDVLKQLLGRLESKLAFLVLEPGATLPRASRVRLPDTEVGLDAFGAAIPLEPGTLNVEVLAPGHEPRRSSLRLRAGEHRRLLVSAGARRQARPPRTLLARTRTRSPWPLLTAGVAGAGYVGSGVLGLQALQEKRDMRRECDAFGCSDQGLASAARGASFAQASTLTFVGASLTLGASVLLYLLGERDAPSPASAGSSLTMHY
jgi:hypothetical protein